MPAPQILHGQQKIDRPSRGFSACSTLLISKNVGQKQRESDKLQLPTPPSSELLEQPKKGEHHAKQPKFQPEGLSMIQWLQRLLLPLASAIALATSSVAFAQVCAIPGNDGPVTITGVPNTYYAAPAGNTASGSTITLGAIRGAPGATTPIAAGDLILIMQMQDGSGTDFSTAATYGTGTGTAGLYEYARVTDVTGVTVTLANSLVNTYVQDYANRQTYQVIRVPQYSSAIISGVVSAAPWDVDTTTGAASGGVVAIDVSGSLTMNAGANIDVSGQGFRGGAGRNGTGNRTGGLFSDLRYPADATNANGASKGEGTAGTPRFVFNGTATPLDYGVDGYTNGSYGQGSPGNAGGGGNDGTPPTGTNQFNSGGGGGGNAGAGGGGGNSWSNNNAAGGAGGKAATNSATRLVLGGGGGAGSSNNNTTANVVSIYPPTPISPTPRGNTTNPVANGAQGAITLSGAAGGGIVLVRTGTINAVAGAQINADGYRAYNTNGNAANAASTATTTSSEGAGAGGAGGSVFITSTSGTGANLTINARGGNGGDPDFYDHGPGGGGGGGFVLRSTNLTGLAATVTGGVNGLEGIKGPDPTPPANAYGSTPGIDGSGTTTTTTAATGISGGAVCLPALTVTKSTSTPVRTSQTTGTYTITVSNAASLGTATGVNVVDVLPAPFNYTPVAVTPVYSGGASGPASVTPTTAVAGGVTTITVGTAGGTATNSFTIPAGGQVSLTLTVGLNGAAPGTYQNPANANYLDPTRNVAGTTIQPSGAYQTGGGNAGGSNYASGSSTNEDIVILAAPSLVKVFNPRFVAPGQTSRLTITIGNSNATQSTLTSAFTDTMPGTVILATPANASTTCLASGTGTTTATPVTTTTSIGLLNAARVPVGGCTVSVDVISNSAGSFNNVIPAGALTTDAGNNVIAAATLAVTQPLKSVRLFSDVDNSNSVSPGDILEYRIAFTNPNTPDAGLALTGLQLTDATPAQLGNATNLAIESQTAGTGAIANTSFTGKAPNTTLLSTTGTLAPAGTIVLTFRASITGAAGVNIDNTAVVSSTTAGFPASGLLSDADTTATGTFTNPIAQPQDQDSPARTDATRVTPVAPSADLVITKSQPSPAVVNSGGNVTYTVTVTNNGPNAAQNVVITDTLPAGSTFVGASNGGTQAAGVVTWNSTTTPALSSLANTASQTFTVTITAP